MEPSVEIKETATKLRQLLEQCGLSNSELFTALKKFLEPQIVTNLFTISQDTVLDVD